MSTVDTGAGRGRSRSGRSTRAPPSWRRSSPAPARRAVGERRLPEPDDVPDRGCSTRSWRGCCATIRASRSSTRRARASRASASTCSSARSMLQGRRPEMDELMVTSGGMECITLAGLALLDPGDVVAVEAPTYLGALMAFAGFEAEVDGHPDGRGRPAGRRARGAPRRRPAPEVDLPHPGVPEPDRPHADARARQALIELCRRHGVLILEDVAYREMSFDGGALPSLWSLGARRRRAGRHVLEDLLPRRAARLGGRAGGRDRPDGGGQADRRPVRERARPAHRGGVRARRALRAPDPGVACALRAGLAGGRGGAARAHAARCRLERAERRVLHLARRCRTGWTRASCARPRSRPA